METKSTALAAPGQLAPPPAALAQICPPDNWSKVLDNPAPRAIRWAHTEDVFRNVKWTKWHYTEGNGFFTACRRPVVPWVVDGSPEERPVDAVSCRLCRARMAAAASKKGSA